MAPTCHGPQMVLSTQVSGDLARPGADKDNNDSTQILVRQSCLIF